MKVSIWKVVLGLAIIALLVGGGSMLYRVGYARGVTSDMSFEDMPFAYGNFEDGDFEGMMPYGRMPGAYGMRGYYGYNHFSLGRMLFGGFVFFLIVGVIFRLFGMRRYGCMPPWSMHRMGYEGKEGPPWMRHHPYWDKMNPEGEAKEESEE